jgi:hypothetical protein
VFFIYLGVKMGFSRLCLWWVEAKVVGITRCQLVALCFYLYLFLLVVVLFVPLLVLYIIDG